MERTYVVAATVVAAVLVLVAGRAIVDRDSEPASSAPAVGRPGTVGEDAAIPPRHEREARRSALLHQLPEQSRGVGADGSAADDDAPGHLGAPVVIAGQRRIGASTGADSGGQSLPSDTGADRHAAVAAPADAPGGARNGSAGQARSGGAAPAAKAEAAEARAEDAVLLSIPLKGSVEPEKGDSPTQADGVVVDGEVVEFTDQAQYSLPAQGHVNSQAGSIAFDIQPNWNGDEEGNHSLLQIRNEDQVANSLQIVKNLDSLRFILVDAAGAQTDVSVGIADWQAGEPHHVTATWGDAVMVLYVDGQPVGQTPIAGSPAFRPTTPIHVGSDFPGSQYPSADARIGNLIVQGRALRPDEVH